MPAELEDVIHRALEKDRELRYQHAADMRADLQRLKRDSDSHRFAAGLGRRRLRTGGSGGSALTAVVIVAATVAGYFVSHRPAKLTDKDTIVLADFDNKTGDAVFDDTLKQGLSVQLEQSPFLDLVSERRVNDTLKLMGRPAGDRLTPEVTREVCQRTGSRAMLTGSIAALGSQYVIGLKAVNCNTGDVLAEAQEQAAGKEAGAQGSGRCCGQLTEQAGRIAQLRAEVCHANGGSDHAIVGGTESLQLGTEDARCEGRNCRAALLQAGSGTRPEFRRGLRPHFGRLRQPQRSGTGGGVCAQGLRAAEEGKRARAILHRGWLLPDCDGGAGKGGAEPTNCGSRPIRETKFPYINLGAIYGSLGNWEKALGEARQAMRLEPNDGVNYYLNLGNGYAALNRLDEAEAVYKQAEERKLESECLLANRYQLAFLKSDTAQMAQLAAAAMGKPGTEDLLLAAQADTEAWYGKLKNARELTRRAMDSAEHNDAKETAATYQAAAALREVESGNRKQALPMPMQQ